MADLSSNIDILKEKAIALGASAAKEIAVSSIRRGAWTRMKCQFGCEQYGKCLCCPPYIPDYDFMDRFLHEYEEALLVQYKRPITADDLKHWQKADGDASNGLLHILVRLEQQAFFMNHYKAFALKAGKCYLCPVCNLKHCIHPDLARPSAEACGIDVFALANDNGFDARVYRTMPKELTLYGLLLVG